MTESTSRNTTTPPAGRPDRGRAHRAAPRKARLGADWHPRPLWAGVRLGRPAPPLDPAGPLPGGRGLPQAPDRATRGGATVIPCPLCGILQDDPWMNFHLINGHGFSGGPGLPSPHTNSLVASEWYRDGGRGASESASGSPGRPSEKGGQRSPQGQGGAIAPIEVSEADKTSGISLTQRQAASDWITNHFYKKGGVGDEWRQIVGAAKAFGMQKGEKWRDWVKSRWDSEGPARDAVIRMLIKAGLVPNDAKAEAVKNPVKAKVLELLLKRDLPLADLTAQAGPTVDQTMLDGLTDAGLIYPLKEKEGYYALSDRPKGG